jgi:hypothetical protein
MKTYAVRISCCCGEFDFSAIKKYWSGQIIVHRNDLEKQCFDFVPPGDFIGSEAKIWAEKFARALKDDDGADAQVVELSLD